MTYKTTNDADEFSLRYSIIILKEWINFLLTKWKIILFIGLIGGIVGLFYSYIKPVNYNAKITFILEETKNSSSGLGGLVSLAGQFGVDVGSGSGGGILSGDNILSYFKSPSLSREVLMTRYDSSSDLSFADVYAKVYRLDEDWKKSVNIGEVKFSLSNSFNSYTRLQDSLLQNISETIIKNQFNVVRPDKKASFIEVSVSMQDELLAKMYCERIVQRVVDRYITVKIQRQTATVDKLQFRLDSIQNLLRQKTESGATLQNSSSVMDINPLFKTSTSVAVETTLRDKTILSTIFASISQNLEMAKFTLSQETPVIQIIDAPILPLKNDKANKFKIVFLFSLNSILFICFCYLVKRLYKNLIT